MSQTLPVLQVESSAELIPLLEVYRFLRAGFTQAEVDADYQNEIVTMLLSAAIKGTERTLNYDIRERQWLYTITNFSSYVNLPKYPFVSLETLKYYDTDNTLQTLSASAYSVQNRTNAMAWIDFDLSLVPDTYDREDAIQIVFKSGKNTLLGDDRLATLLAVSAFYDDRSNNGKKYPAASERLLRNHRFNNF